MKFKLILAVVLIIISSGCINSQADQLNPNREEISDSERFSQLVSESETAKYSVKYTGDDTGVTGSILGTPNLEVTQFGGWTSYKTGHDLSGVKAEISFYENDQIRLSCRDITYQGENIVKCSSVPDITRNIGGENITYSSYTQKYTELGVEKNVEFVGESEVLGRTCERFRYSFEPRISYSLPELDRNVSICLDSEKGFVSHLEVQTDSDAEVTKTVTYRMESYSEQIDMEDLKPPVDAILKQEFGDSHVEIIPVDSPEKVRITSDGFSRTVNFDPIKPEPKRINISEIEGDFPEVTLDDGNIKQMYTVMN